MKPQDGVNSVNFHIVLTILIYYIKVYSFLYIYIKQIIYIKNFFQHKLLANLWDFQYL